MKNARMKDLDDLISKKSKNRRSKNLIVSEPLRRNNNISEKNQDVKNEEYMNE